MALIYYMKRALGFDNTEDETEQEENPFIRPSKGQSITDISHKDLIPVADDCQDSDKPGTQDMDIPVIDASLPGCIFDSVIRLFNRTMPDFVSKCLDTDSQRQYLYHAIESDVRRQMIRTMEEARINAVHDLNAREPMTATELTNGYRRQLRTSFNNFSREKEAMERRIAELEASIQEANEENARLQNEITMLNRRLRRSKSKTALDDDLQPSLF